MREKGTMWIVLLFVFLLVAGATVLLRVQPTQNPQPTQPRVQLPKITTMNEETSVNHPDGTMKLIMRTKKNPDGARVYSFFTADVSGGNEKLIFTKAFDPNRADTTMAIPLNAWTPAKGSYVFVEEHTATASNYLVLQTSGEPFANKQQYLDVVSLFKEKNIKYTFGGATGWASPTLLIFTTITDTGTKGPNYWFEVPSLAFLQLAR